MSNKNWKYFSLNNASFECKILLIVRVNLFIEILLSKSFGMKMEPVLKKKKWKLIILE